MLLLLLLKAASTDYWTGNPQSTYYDEQVIILCVCVCFLINQIETE